VEIFIFCSKFKSLYSTQAHIEFKSSNFNIFKISNNASLFIQQFLKDSKTSHGFLFTYGSFNSKLESVPIFDINHPFSYQTVASKSEAISGV
jgi:hypothetical protein